MANPTPDDFLKFFRAVFNAASSPDSQMEVKKILKAAVKRYKLPAPTTKGFGSGPIKQAGKSATSFKYDYVDGEDFSVASSWIKAVQFMPMGGRNLAAPKKKGYQPTNADKGDLTMEVLRPSAPNPSGRYTYPHVPRSVMDKMVKADSKGKFYWKTLRFYSNRSLIGRRMKASSRLKMSKRKRKK